LFKGKLGEIKLGQKGMRKKWDDMEEKMRNTIKKSKMELDKRHWKSGW